MIIILIISTGNEESFCERGNHFIIRRALEKAKQIDATDKFDINCSDPLGRSALLMAIDNENLEMVELLLEYNIETRDALLHAISEEYVEAVELLLDHEDALHQPGMPHVSNTSLFSKILIGIHL